jgi:hypothetical protein
MLEAPKPPLPELCPRPISRPIVSPDTSRDRYHQTPLAHATYLPNRPHCGRDRDMPNGRFSGLSNRSVVAEWARYYYLL